MKGVSIMEAMVYSSEFINVTVAVAGLFALLAAAMAGILFGYVADEEATRRRIEWLDEPLATAARPVRLERVELRKAA
jgi:hypothetical protein